MYIKIDALASTLCAGAVIWTTTTTTKEKKNNGVGEYIIHTNPLVKTCCAPVIQRIIAICLGLKRLIEALN